MTSYIGKRKDSLASMDSGVFDDISGERHSQIAFRPAYEERRLPARHADSVDVRMAVCAGELAREGLVPLGEGAQLDRAAQARR